MPWARGVALAACLLAALYALTFPLQDFDTFWHLAYGRAMVESGSFINHEMFSYTAAGKYLGSHSQLAQVVLYLLWAAGGAHALLGFKLLMAALAFLLIVATARLFGLDRAAGAALALAVLAAGMSRVVERPELFSILLQALLTWLLFRARSGGYAGRELWALPPLLVAWDYLHGALYGLVVLLCFAAAEAVRVAVLPRLRLRWGSGDPGPVRLKRLLLWVGISLGAMAVHPNGLLDYGGLLRVGTSAEFRMYGEFMAPTALQFAPYWIFLAAALALLAWRWQRLDITVVAVLLPFLLLSLTYSRAVLAFCLAAVPAVSQGLTFVVAGRGEGRRLGLATSALIAVLVATVVIYKNVFVIDAFRFGTGVSERVFPVGSARFVKERNLAGDMYNMNGFGGYLAFFLGPQRKIFHYNQPGVFTALYDYLHRPASRRQWQIAYAIVGDVMEHDMFAREGYVTIYQEPTAAVMVRNDEGHAALIERFRVRQFGPLRTDNELLTRAANPVRAEALLREMADYLAFREDARIAALFARLLRESPAVPKLANAAELVAPTLRYNGGSVPLVVAFGELLGQQGDLDGAAEQFARALRLAPEDYAARSGMASVEYGRGQYAAALERFARLVAQSPDVAEGYFGLGLAALRLCRKDEARRALERFLALAPGSPYALKARESLGVLDNACP